jgi:serine phosphatase RsbU (regulator of sigma subunit)
MDAPAGGAAAAGNARTTDFKGLYRKLETALDRIERSDNTSSTLMQILDSLVEDFQEELGFEGGRLYRREEDDFYLAYGTGKSRNAPVGYLVPAEYPGHRRTLEEGILIMRPGDPEFDREIEGAIGVSSTFAAIAIGEGNSHIMAFSVRGLPLEEQIFYSLSAVRHVVNLKLQQQQLTGMLEESRIIQESLLPPRAPVFEGYDVNGSSRPTEFVGGDLYDFLPLSERLLGVAIGDASGHGLPAALLARDVITGLRMGMDENLKVVRSMEKLNRVIHRASLSSRFISLFYGEFDRDGTLIYCNAGHNPPLLLRGGAFIELTHGGLVLGPNANARYDRGHLHLIRGDTVIMFTDGLTEREDTRGNQFGNSRLRRLLRKMNGSGAADIVSALFAASEAHARGAPQRDDLTLVVVRKT